MNSPLDSILPEIASLIASLKPKPAWWILDWCGEPIGDATYATEADADAAIASGTLAAMDAAGPHYEIAPVSIQLTIGATILPDGTASWSYQTGDNSFTGGAYGHATWGVAWISHESDPEEIAREIVDEIDSQLSY